jgi:hypothetical protein
LLNETQLDEEQFERTKDMSLKKRAIEVYKLTKNEDINTLLQDLLGVFEWTDGILVNAM